ncbi:MAG: 4-alpha-glucanotransferase, partial [Bacteroidota bacterium]
SRAYASASFKLLPDNSEKELLLQDKNICRSLIERALRSRANMAVIPMQDLLALDSRARMNRPGTATGNWKWRMSGNVFTDELIKWMKNLTVETGR